MLDRFLKTALFIHASFKTRKFYIRMNNNKVDSTETLRIVIADFLPWSGLQKRMYTTLFLINDNKILSSLLNLWIQLYLSTLLTDALVNKQYKNHFKFKGNFYF